MLAPAPGYLTQRVSVFKLLLQLASPKQAGMSSIQLLQMKSMSELFAKNSPVSDLVEYVSYYFHQNQVLH